MPPGKPYPKEVIQKIREEVLKGKTKYRVAKEMGINQLVVYSHTSDLPSVKLGEPCIKGKSLDLLKQLLDVGYVASNQETCAILKKLRRHLPMIQCTQIDNKSIYYLNDKNKDALKAMITLNKSRIISYQELKSITKVFGVNLSRDEKQDYVRPIRNRSIPIIRKKDGGFLSSLKKNQARLDDFTTKNGFLGKNGLKNRQKNQYSKNGSLLENVDSLVDFCIRKYCFGKNKGTKIPYFLPLICSSWFFTINSSSFIFISLIRSKKPNKYDDVRTRARSLVRISTDAVYGANQSTISMS